MPWSPFLWIFWPLNRNKCLWGNWIKPGLQRVQLQVVEPQQYLGRELPSTHCIQKIVAEIFDDFIAENAKDPADMLLTY